ncbi:hypothetical protein [Pseudomonas sp. F3-2]|uniref:hypothetical protein n=2 Tax=unclassified Pseudomonas TaxID=196821 RepID=UPI00315D136B
MIGFHKNNFAGSELLKASSGLSIRSPMHACFIDERSATYSALYREDIKMNRLLLPVMGTLFLCAQSFSVLAADSTSAATDAASLQHQREQIEAKRDQISGVAQLSKRTDAGTAAVIDTPVATDDAPAQEQQP